MEPTSKALARLILPDCPGCDEGVAVENLAPNELTRCPNCHSTLLLVRIDGVLMFLRDGWV